MTKLLVIFQTAVLFFLIFLYVQALLSCLVAACAAEADPSHLYGGLLGHPGYAGQDARFAYGRPITALDAPYNAYGGPSYLGATAHAAYAYAPAAYAAPAAHVAYAPAAVAPAVHAAPVAPVVSGPVSSQYQAQDELGNTAYGYSNINSAKHEQGNAESGVTGSYSYNDEAGTHTISYVADHYGFRLVAPTNALVGGPVVDTPEVAGAKAAFFAAYDAAASQGHRRRRSAPILAAAPLAAAAPAREAVLTTIKLNPGHAIFYRVD